METYTPGQLHIQDATSEHSGLEHSDNFHAAEFAASAAEDYSGAVTVTSYNGYATWVSEGMLIDSYEEWVMREYVADEYTMAGDAEMAALNEAEEHEPLLV